MSKLDIHIIPCLFDNYSYLIRDKASGATAVVDAPDKDPVLTLLKQNGWQLDYILNTHHHMDHIGANLALKKATGCKIVGSELDRDRIPGIDITVADGDTLLLGETTAEILHIPGHTRGHIAFWFPEGQALFPGDTLFALGCGRVFEGTFEEMWTSLDRLRQLPDDTKIYCGHEYTVNNAEFALTVDPGNPQLQERFKLAQELQSQNLPTVPSSIAEEKATNPFLRPESPEIRASLGLTDASPAEVFSRIRQAKDAF